MGCKEVWGGGSAQGPGAPPVGGTHLEEVWTKPLSAWLRLTRRREQLPTARNVVLGKTQQNFQQIKLVLTSNGFHSEAPRGADI